MPKDGKIKTGIPELDRLRPALKIPKASNEKEKAENAEYRSYKKLGYYIRMMELFGINPKDKNCWMQLSIELAERFVPGVQYRKSNGSPEKWNCTTHWALHGLYEIAAFDNPMFLKYQLDELIPDMAQETILKDIIKKTAKPESVRKRYNKYLKSEEFRMYNEGMDKYSTKELLASHYHVLYLSNKKTGN